MESELHLQQSRTELLFANWPEINRKHFKHIYLILRFGDISLEIQLLSVNGASDFQWYLEVVWAYENSSDKKTIQLPILYTLSVAAYIRNKLEECTRTYIMYILC